LKGIRLTAIDNEILVVFCQDEGTLYRLSVDDFQDEDEEEISRDQIHLTLVKMELGKGETPLSPCLKLSTTSAKQLIRKLAEAIAKRGGDS
jgi:hypothetical protein